MCWPNVQDARVKVCPLPSRPRSYSKRSVKSLVCLLPHGGILEEEEGNLALFRRGDRMYKRTTGPWPKGKEEVGSERN